MKNYKDSKEQTPNTDEDKNKNHKKEFFEFSFLQMTLKAEGASQEEIRKTVTETWWLPVISYIVICLVIVFAGKELLEKLLPLLLGH